MVVRNKSIPQLAPNDYPNALGYIQNNAPGYQLEYYPIDRVKDPSMTLANCAVYGVSNVAIQICLKNSGSSLMAGNFPFLPEPIF